jgi:GH43 family beta-xylosidase
LHAVVAQPLSNFCLHVKACQVGRPFFSAQPMHDDWRCVAMPTQLHPRAQGQGRRGFWRVEPEALIILRQERKLFIFRKNYFADRNYCLDLLLQSAKLPVSVNGYYNPEQSLIRSVEFGKDCSTFTMVNKTSRRGHL